MAALLLNSTLLSAKASVASGVTSRVAKRAAKRAAFAVRASDDDDVMGQIGLGDLEDIMDKADGGASVPKFIEGLGIEPLTEAFKFLGSDKMTGPGSEALFVEINPFMNPALAAGASPFITHCTIDKLLDFFLSLDNFFLSNPMVLAWFFSCLEHPKNKFCSTSFIQSLFVCVCACVCVCVFCFEDCIDRLIFGPCFRQSGWVKVR